MSSSLKYSFPACLEGQCLPAEFGKWLERKARSLSQRDKKRGNKSAQRAPYKVAIYQAVVRSQGRDVYTGKSLRWDLISKYDNDTSKKEGRKYKKDFGDLPTVDHVNEVSGPTDFNICSWRINDAKHDLTLDEFTAVCREILEFQKVKRDHTTCPQCGSQID